MCLTQYSVEATTYTAERILRMAFHLPESIPCITQLRNATGRLMEHLGIHQEDREEVGLLIAELASNALRHTHGDYIVELEFFRNLAVVQVVDEGEGFSRESIPEPGSYRTDDISTTGEQRVGGFGLLLVEAIADDLDIRRNIDKGMTVCAKKKLRYAI